MIKVVVGNNINREDVIVSSETTIREILEDKEIDYTRGGITLDGVTLRNGDFDRSLADLGIKDRCYLIQVIKTDNAVC